MPASKVSVPFAPGRVDATHEQTEVPSFTYLEPKADGCRNDGIGWWHALAAGNTRHGVLTERPGTLSNDFFVNLLTMDTVWSKSTKASGIYEGKDRASGAAKWAATPVDLVFGSNSELRAVAEVYASDDAVQKFVDDFVQAWSKVMNADRSN